MSNRGGMNRMKQDIPKWTTGMVKVSNRSYAYLQAKGTMGLSNAGLYIGEKYTVIIDTLTSESLSQKFLNEVKRITHKNIKYLLITHHHADHCMGNHLLPDAISICQDNCYAEIERMSHLSFSQIAPVTNPEIDFTGSHYTLPTMSFGDSLTIYDDTHEIRLIHFGFAHTIGDIAVYLPDEGVVYCGDLFFLFSTPSGSNAFFKGWIECIEKLSELKADKYIPGHGPVSDREGLLNCREYLMLIYDESRKGYDAGKSPFDVARNIFLGEFKHWAEPQRIVINVERLYKEFRGEQPISPMDTKMHLRQMHELLESSWFSNASDK
jgi:cyclase